MAEMRIVLNEIENRKTPPTYEFIEIEDENGKSINVGQWRKRDDDYWEIVIER